jgi:hypothetical protein
MQRSFVNHSDQKNFGIAQLATEWIIIVDADERVSAPLAAEILQRVRSADTDDGYDGFWLYRSNHFFGRAISGAGWRRDRVLRLFRRDKGYHPEKLLHEEARLVEGARIGRCLQRLEHFSYESWNSTFARLLSYSSRGAAERARRGRRSSPWRVATRPAARFCRQYLLQGGWREGLHGYVLCTWSAIGVFMREAKLVLDEISVPVVGGGSLEEIRVEVVKGPPPEPAQERRKSQNEPSQEPQ